LLESKLIYANQIGSMNTMVKSLTRIICLFSCLLSFFVSSNETSKESDAKIFITEVSNIYMASSYLIFKQQSLINQKGGDKSSLFGKAFINNIKNAYEAKFNTKFPKENRRLYTSLLKAMIDVMEDNRTLIYDDELSFKGLIPATFAFQLSEKLTQKGLGVKIKFTNFASSIRNKLNLPDQWEVAAMKSFKQNKEKYYFDDESTLNNIPAYRYFVPMKLERFCLNCHGTAKKNPLNVGLDKSQWSNIDVTGFEMENWELGDFGGGLSVTIYKKDFLELEELCELNYISTFACHFFALE